MKNLANLAYEALSDYDLTDGFGDYPISRRERERYVKKNVKSVKRFGTFR